MKKLFLAVIIFSLWPTMGCRSTNAVVAVTSTTLGFKISQDPTTQLYNGELGYVRSEIATVPITNSVDVPDVIMEMKFNGLTSGGGFHQRLSVGKVACSQDSAILMFSRDAKGQVNEGLGQLLLQQAINKTNSAKANAH